MTRWPSSPRSARSKRRATEDDNCLEEERTTRSALRGATSLTPGFAVLRGPQPFSVSSVVKKIQWRSNDPLAFFTTERTEQTEGHGGRKMLGGTANATPRSAWRGG